MALIAASLLANACEAAPSHPQAILIPTASDWVDCGTILEAGPEGAWDHILWGGFALSATKKDGVFHLYYQGSRYYDDAGETVAWRTIGVATSRDGVHFTKHVASPILTWAPRGNLEEGAVSAGLFRNASDEIALAYGANTWTGGNRVSADGRLALSTDGLTFRDVGILLDHNAPIWAGGDEVFPVIAIQEMATRAVYYIPNGGLAPRALGVAWGDTLTLSHSAAATSANSRIAAWGPGSAVPLEPGTYAIFVTNTTEPSGRYVEARTMSLSAPDRLSEPVQTYRFDNMAAGIVFRDPDSGNWFLYYRNADVTGYGVRVARANARSPRDPAAPSSPSADLCGSGGTTAP